MRLHSTQVVRELLVISFHPQFLILVSVDSRIYRAFFTHMRYEYGRTTIDNEGAMTTGKRHS
eukprot:COSAG02_NODE_168_length_31711_cov_68.337973_4_plen_62_part_00